MMKYQINDNELLYLIYEMNDYAFDLLCMKYLPLIKRRITEFRVNQRNYDDFYQEGLIMLDVAVKTYKITMRKSFNKYFDLILQRRFIYLSRRESKYEYHVSFMEDIDTLLFLEEEEVSFDFGSVQLDSLSELEKTSIIEVVYENKRVKDVAEKFNLDERSVYNAVARAKQKIRKIIKKSTA